MTKSEQFKKWAENMRARNLQSPPIQTTARECTTCGRMLPGSEYYRANNRKTGWRKTCKSCDKKRNQQFFKKHPLWHRQYRDRVISEYGSKCRCCKESNPEFLTIDHVNNTGAQHRKEIGRGRIYKWLIENGFPKDGFRLLCYNCNCSFGAYGYCPHVTQTIDAAAVK